MGSSNPRRDVARELDLAGWSVLGDVLPAETVTALGRAVELACARCDAIRTAKGLASGTAGTAHHVLSMDDAFVDFLEAATWVPAAEAALGGVVIINSFGAVDNRGDDGTYVGRVHRDLRSFVPGPPPMVNVLVALDDFTPTSGATSVLPGSHRHPDRPADSAFAAHAEPIVVPAGSVVMFDSRLWHAAGRNVTGRPRRALTLTVTRPMVKPQFDYCRDLGHARVAQCSSAVQQLLGQFARVPATHDEWYQPPEGRLYRGDQG